MSGKSHGHDEMRHAFRPDAIDSDTIHQGSAAEIELEMLSSEKFVSSRRLLPKQPAMPRSAKSYKRKMQPMSTEDLAEPEGTPRIHATPRDQDAPVDALALASELSIPHSDEK
jgi:hypothetical protein